MRLSIARRTQYILEMPELPRPARIATWARNHAPNIFMASFYCDPCFKRRTHGEPR